MAQRTVPTANATTAKSFSNPSVPPEPVAGNTVTVTDPALSGANGADDPALSGAVGVADSGVSHGSRSSRDWARANWSPSNLATSVAVIVGVTLQ